MAFLALASALYYFLGEEIIRSKVWQYISLELDFEQYVCIVALFTVVPHCVEITYQYGFIRGFSWLLKIFTDPITDLIDFWRFAVIHPKWFLDLKDPKAQYKLNLCTKTVTTTSNIILE